jgi:hypothetical protein
MLTQDMIDDLSKHNWIAVTSAEQIAFVTPILSSSEDNRTNGVVVWRLDTVGCEQIDTTEQFLETAPAYIAAIDVLDMDASFSESTDVGTVLRLIAEDASVPTIRTESPSLDMCIVADEVRCEVQTLERHTTFRLYSISIAVAAIRHLWKRRAENLVLTEREVRTQLGSET